MEPAAVSESEDNPLSNSGGGDSSVAAWNLGGGIEGQLIAVGTYTVSADYNGDSNYNYASGTGSFTIEKAASSTTFTSCPSSAVAGQAAPFTVTVVLSTPPTATAAARPTGQVQIGATSTSGGGNAQPVTGSLTPIFGTPTATISIVFPAAGAYIVNAGYQGDGNYNPGTASCNVTATQPPS